MKLRETEAQNLQILKDINQFIAMDKEALIDYIEKDLNHSVRADGLWDIVTALAQDISDLFRRKNRQKSIEPQYPNLNLNNSWSEYYIADFQRVLCKDDLLCTHYCSIKHLTLEEQIDKLNQLIHSQDVFEKYRYRLSSLAVAALILKIGIVEFCGCSKNTE